MGADVLQQDTRDHSYLPRDLYPRIQMKMYWKTAGSRKGARCRTLHDTQTRTWLTFLSAPGRDKLFPNAVAVMILSF